MVVLWALAEAVSIATAITKNNFFIVTNLISLKLKIILSFLLFFKFECKVSKKKDKFQKKSKKSAKISVKIDLYRLLELKKGPSCLINKEITKEKGLHRN
jgi:uncharacterized membrane protein